MTNTSFGLKLISQSGGRSDATQEEHFPSHGSSKENCSKEQSKIVAIRQVDASD